jgi:hypothetical protein
MKRGHIGPRGFELVAAHPSRKNKYPARMGHPDTQHLKTFDLIAWIYERDLQG